MADRPILTITRGLPASGKTSFARVLQETRGPTDVPLVRVNKDDLRAQLHVGEWSAAKERLTVMARDALIAGYLRAGIDVVCDDTNLRDDDVPTLRSLAAAAGARFHIEDLRHVSVEECVRRDALRPNAVGRDVIEGLARRLEGR